MKRIYQHMTLCATSLVIGLAVGVAIDANFHPNYMRVHVDAINKLSIAPQDGDIIQWDLLDQNLSSTPVSIQFPGSAGSNPCAGPAVGGPLAQGICVVNYPDPKGTYLYVCNSGATQVCSDPNVGPKSTTGGGTKQIYSLVGYVKVLLFRIELAVKLWLVNFTGHSQSLQTSSLNANGAAPGAPATLPPPHTAGIYAEVDCDANGNTEEVQAGLPPNSDIPAGSGDSILWGGPHGPSGFILSGADLDTVCTMTGKKCVVKSNITLKKYAYTAKDNTCAVSPTVFINVTK